MRSETVSITCGVVDAASAGSSGNAANPGHKSCKVQVVIAQSRSRTLAKNIHRELPSRLRHCFRESASEATGDSDDRPGPSVVKVRAPGRHWLRLMIGVLGSVLLVSYASADDVVSRYVTDTLRAGQVPGAALAVVKNGRVLKEVLYGAASLELSVPVQRTTRFQLASVTKVFTSIALLLLEQDGALNLDDEVSKYLTDLPESWRHITLRELATHTSGLPDVIASPDMPLSDAELAVSEDDALKLAASHAVSGPAGTKYEYNQTNYVLLKRVIEGVSHESFRHFLSTRVLPSAPAAMPWGDARSIVARRAEMYTALHGDTIENGGDLYRYPRYLEGAAGLNATIVEMESLGIALTNGSLLGSKELGALEKPVPRRGGGPIDLGPELKLDGVLSPSVGMLYADNSSGGFPRLFMTGGSATSIMFFPKQGLFIAVLTNLQAKDDPLGIAEGVAHFYIHGMVPMF